MESAAIAPRRPPLAILVAISTLQPFALNVLAPATPGMARSLETDYATIQLTLTVYLVAVAVTQLVVGPISDRVGRRPCVIGAIGLFIGGSMLGAFASSVEALVLARVVQGIGGGTCFALSRAIVRDVASQDEAASLIGYITMAMVVSPMVAPLVGGFLDASFGWRSVFVATLALAAPVALLTFAYLPETLRRGAAAASLGDIARALPDLARTPAFLAAAVILGFTTASFFVLIAGAPYVVVEAMGRDPEVYGAFFLFNAGGYMAGNFVTGRVGRRIGSERLIRIGVSLSLVSVVACLLVLGIGPWTPASLFLPLMLNAFGNGLTIPCGTALALSVRPDLAGTAAGLVGAFQLGLGAIGVLAVGYAVEMLPTAVPWGMFLCAVIAAAAALASARRAGGGH